MKKSIIATSIILALSSSSATSAAFFAPDTTYNVTVQSGCFGFSNCVTLGYTNATTDSFTITTDVSGGAFTVGNYLGTNAIVGPLGQFDLGGPVAGNGTVSSTGQLDLNFAGRTGNAQFFPQYLGLAWNIDDSSRIATATGNYEGFTTGSDSNFYTSDDLFAPDGIVETLTGTNLVATGNGSWTATLVSAGNTGDSWIPIFSGTAYTEALNIEISAVPVPAAVWLFGSGLLTLIGIARRRRV